MASKIENDCLNRKEEFYQRLKSIRKKSITSNMPFKDIERLFFQPIPPAISKRILKAIALQLFLVAIFTALCYLAFGV
jgi:hypothetical protein